MPESEQEQSRRAYLKAWFAVAGNDAARFTWLTIEEIGIAREAEASRGTREGSAAIEKDQRLRTPPPARRSARGRRR